MEIQQLYVTENYNDGKLPILELKVWIEHDRNKKKKILYTHYMKDVSTKKLIQVNSAHGEKNETKCISE